ncbi:hypothetical protein NQ315_002458 [Exocentrus adspersus]|uniref:Uncharacterized protein n=1 Tax=Exocentrus adspersus TaxID=1586481 RepID=A0AAV8V8C1_9CUCU|nr:hypothetical protein NQ315_002458 [Exocentrus adspersus]
MEKKTKKAFLSGSDRIKGQAVLDEIFKIMGLCSFPLGAEKSGCKIFVGIERFIEKVKLILIKTKLRLELRKNKDLSLIKYITGDAENPPLKPHFIKSTSAINEARRLVTQLSQPLADISQLINDNLFILQRHQENFDLNTDTLEELKQKLYMPVINLQVITLTQPVTVCTAKKCAEVYKSYRIGLNASQ